MRPVCDGLPNTSGQSARLTVGDPAAAGTTTLGFRVDGLPPGHAALMLYGLSAGSTQAGAGVLCIGSPPIALPRPAIADATGTARFSVDLTAFPGVGQVLAGDSFVLQCTYRDAQTVHFSSASSVTIL